MGFNYGYEKKKFDSRWKRLEVEYCDAGMSEEQIAAMKEYDWAWFCSQRVFQNHTQPIPCEQYDEVCGPITAVPKVCIVILSMGC